MEGRRICCPAIKKKGEGVLDRERKGWRKGVHCMKEDTFLHENWKYSHGCMRVGDEGGGRGESQAQEKLSSPAPTREGNRIKV